jgi:hypothetical protein
MFSLMGMGQKELAFWRSISIQTEAVQDSRQGTNSHHDLDGHVSLVSPISFTSTLGCSRAYHCPNSRTISHFF